MYKSYFIVAVRNMLRQKMHNILNIVGLSVGIASGLFIAIHIRGELSYETSFPDYENIYRVHRDGWAASSPALAHEFSTFFPEVETIGRFAPYGVRVVNTENNNPGEATGFYADSSVVDVFGFKLIEGSSDLLTVVNTAVITQTMAKRYFGTQSPMGKILKLDNGAEITVTGVMQDLPANTHLKFDYLVSMPTFYQDGRKDADKSRGWMIMYSYARLRPGTIDKVSAKMPQFIRKYYTGDPEVEQKVAAGVWRMMPAKDIHLHSNLEKEMSPNSNIVYVYIFLAIELLILTVASANFMTLFTTQALKRVKEVGMRKIIGAKPVQLATQFLTEIVLLVVFSALLGMVLYQFALPVYNDLTGKSLQPLEIFKTGNLVMIGFMLLTVILVSGIYPAVFIAGFKPDSFLRERKMRQSVPNVVRSGLLIFQFAVSVSLIAAAIIVKQQMHLMKNKELGFDKDQVINVKLYGDLFQLAHEDADAVKGEFLKNPDVLAVGRVDRIIGERLSIETMVPEGKDQERDQIPDMRVLRADEGYLEAMNIDLAEGRNFSPAFNDVASFIVNESAAKALQITSAVGEVLENKSNPRKGRIIGVVKDYHFATLHAEIEPLVIEFKPQWTDNLVFRVRAGKTREALEYISETVDRLAPNSLFVYDFLDERIEALYKSEDTMGKIFQFFSVLAIIIACMGLFGLSSYTIERRAKEIGIRKVLGASVIAIVSLVSTPVLRLILIGFGIAAPLTWYGVQQWLDNFAYKVEVEWWVFAATALIIVVVAGVAIGFRTVRAAVSNPVDTLRTE